MGDQLQNLSGRILLSDFIRISISISIIQRHPHLGGDYMENSSKCQINSKPWVYFQTVITASGIFFFFFYSTLIFVFTLNKRINQDGLRTFVYIFVGGWTVLLTCMCLIYFVDQPQKMLHPGLFLFILKICLASSLKNYVFQKCKLMLRQAEVARPQTKL